MSPAEANQQIAEVLRQQLNEDYGGKASNQFVDEIKRSTLFQFNWGELLSAAPTALSLMGTSWVAASDPKADSVSLTDSMPTGGFQYLTNRKNPTLKSCLVDLCNNGGREAFTLAGRNMDALQIRSQRIVAERIDLIFKLLGQCTKGEDELEDFRDALQAFAKEARDCAQLATETREAFTKWGKMTGELYSCTETQMGTAAIKQDATKIDESVAQVEKKFASQASEDAKAGASRSAKSLKKAEERLEKAIDKVPGPLESVLSSIATSYTQALPHIVAGVVPAVLSAANPAAVAHASGQAAPTNIISDAAYTVAAEFRSIVSFFYDFLGGETGKPDWSKFAGAEGHSEEAQSGSEYFLNTFKGYAGRFDSTGTEPNLKLEGVFEKLTKLTSDIQSHVKSQSDLNAAGIDDNTLAIWKREAKQARDDTVALATVAKAFGGGSVPNAFSNIKMDVPRNDNSAQIAQINLAAQGVQMTQQAADNAQANYGDAIAKQQKTAAAMASIEQKLKQLQEEGQTMQQVKEILRDSVSVLVDLTIQIGKLEQFYIMLSAVIDSIVLQRCDSFREDMDRGGRRALANGLLKFSDLSKQTIYTVTLQTKAYFSLLQDIAAMYTRIHRGYIIGGVDLCATLSKYAATREPMGDVQQRLTDFTQHSSREVADIVKAEQEKMLNGLRERARKAVETTKLVEEAVERDGVKIDSSARQAIQAGGETGKQQAKAILDANPSATVMG